MSHLTFNYKQTKCLSCENETFENLYERHETIATRNHTYVFNACDVICLACGLVQMNPIPDQKQLEDYYNDKFLHVVGEPDYDLEKRIQFLKKVSGTRRKLLEIGSNDGAFVRAAQSHGFLAIGYEPNAQAESTALNSSTHYDIIVANHVLEHISDPIEFLNGLKKMLSPDGLLIFEVPNLNEYPHESMAVFHEHLFHFTPNHLGYIFSRAGYLVEDFEFTMVSRRIGFTILARNAKPEQSWPLPQEYVANRRLFLSAIDNIRERENTYKSVIPTLIERGANRKVALWGSNLIMSRILHASESDNFDLLLVVDACKDKWNKPAAPNIPINVHSPESLIRAKNEVAFVVICAVSYKDEIKRTLRSYGYNDEQVVVAPF
jgi:SAM-dependent methyltransferase